MVIEKFVRVQLNQLCFFYVGWFECFFVFDYLEKKLKEENFDLGFGVLINLCKMLCTELDLGKKLFILGLEIWAIFYFSS